MALDNARPSLARVTDTRRVLLDRLVDDAALFPPASLDLESAVRAHAGHRAGPWAWMLGRFLCPASRLDALAAVDGSPHGLAVGVILDSAGRAAARAYEAALEADLDAVATVTASTDRVRLEAIEVRLPEATTDCIGEVAAAVTAAGVSSTVNLYVEAPMSTDAASLEATVRAAASVRAGTGAMLGAKVRCGGTSPGSVPGSSTLARFVAEAVATGVPFKATAGLHHPSPTLDAVTGDRMHGFLHLAAATALLGTSAITESDADALLGDDEPSAVRLDASGLGWRGHRADAGAVRTCRVVAYHGHGSCSFDEPVADLQASGVLEGAG